MNNSIKYITMIEEQCIAKVGYSDCDSRHSNKFMHISHIYLQLPHGGGNIDNPW